MTGPPQVCNDINGLASEPSGERVRALALCGFGPYPKPMTSQAITRKDAQNPHIANLKPNNALPSFPVLSQAAIDRALSASAIREALLLLAPWRPARIPVDTLRQWRNGTRRAPQWFLALLRDRLAELEARASAARNGLAEYQGGRGRGAGLRDYWKAKKQRDRLPGSAP